MQSPARYDVIIVGGRPAGAALAAHLGASGVRVLVLERAEHPSIPAVPSSPILYPSAMQLLDELGVDEARYSDPHARMRSLAFDFDPFWGTELTMPMFSGRDYVMGVERAVLDHALWENLARYPSVERRTGANVTDVARDGAGRVVGVLVQGQGRIEAGCVIGADGRFSLVARRVGAPVVEEVNHTSTVYYASWEGVAPARPGHHGAQVCTTGRGLDILFFALPRGRFCVNTHARSDRTDIAGDPQRYYQQTVLSVPSAARRLASARQITHVVGLKRVANAYRRASGPGWALVGDALHHKDPVDGQGIYDALLEAKLLAAALREVRAGAAWADAMARYEREVRQATHPMFLATTARLKRELYDEPPVPVIRTALRWMMTDPTYQRQFLRYLNRDIPPNGWMTPSLIGGAMLRGLARDARRLLGRA
jgi:2-polyprenyl-6-methoxyphenol hydroxylase-like FAD-dependent oxidoreductase